MSYLYCPEVVWNNDNLNLTEKVLLGRIIALSNKFGYCNASNKFFADELKITQRSVSAYITRLERIGFLKRYVEYKENTNEIIGRKLYFVFEALKGDSTDPMEKKANSTPPMENISTPLWKNFLHTLDNKQIDIYEESEDSSASTLARELGMDDLKQPIKEEKKSQKISAEDRAINSAIIEEMKLICGVVALPQSSGQQRIFANFIRKRFQDALDPQYYYKEEVLRRLRETTDSMSKDKFLKSRMADLKFFYYKMVLHNSLFSKEAKKEVYL